jgi:hypothetical protein
MSTIPVVTSENDRPAVTLENDRPAAAAPENSRSAVTPKKDRANLCSFTFADGRRCRTPRSSGHAHLCFFHARKEAQAKAAEGIGEDISFFLSDRYISACDLSVSLSRIITGVVQGHIKPRTASTVAYLAQTLLQTIPMAEREYRLSLGTDSWRNTVFTHVRNNGNYMDPPPAEAPQATDQGPNQGSNQETAANRETSANHDQAHPQLPVPAATAPSE